MGLVECDYVDTIFALEVSDGTLTDTAWVTLLIDTSNQPPLILDSIDRVEVKNGHDFSYYPSVLDPDDSDHTIAYPLFPHWCEIQNDSVAGIAPNELWVEPLKVIVSDYCNADTFMFVIETYLTGDVNGSGAVDIDDVVYLINYIFAGGPGPEPLDSGDANCSGGVDIDDVVYLIAYIFSGGPPPGDLDNDGLPDC